MQISGSSDTEYFRTGTQSFDTDQSYA